MVRRQPPCGKGEKGFLLYIPIEHLAAGKKHLLTVGYRSLGDSAEIA
ncbi:hypothetical protein [Rhodoflexus sp.]